MKHTRMLQIYNNAEKQEERERWRKREREKENGERKQEIEQGEGDGYSISNRVKHTMNHGVLNISTKTQPNKEYYTSHNQCVCINVGVRGDPLISFQCIAIIIKEAGTRVAKTNGIYSQ